MLGKRVKVTVDRPLGTYHPQYKDLYYPINYGFVEGIMAPDGEEQDVYIIGVDKPVSEFEGIVIAIIRRNDDVEEKWVFCKHKERDTYEFPGGHKEDGEIIIETARRELYEETGATDFFIKRVCYYSVKSPEMFDGKETFGLFYYAEIREFEEELHSEIEKIIITDELPTRWTYPLIQPILLAKLKSRNIR